MKLFKRMFGEGDREHVEINLGGRRQAVNSGWFRGGEARYRRRKSAMLSPEAVQEAILDGWIPPAPVIDKNTRILTFGSCFAGNIARHLGAAGFNLVGEKDAGGDVFLVACNEGIVNTFTIRQMFEWVYRNKAPHEPMWREAGSTLHRFSEDQRLKTRALFDSAEVFIITLGLSEVWYNRETGDVFSSSIPRSIYDESKHGFRVSTVEENRQNLDVVYSLIREHKPDARIIMTLSPVPLVATFRNVSCVSANSVSKAILRVAVDEVIRSKSGDDRLHYWPSYEIVMEGFLDSLREDNRHVQPDILTFIMTLFEKVYCANGPSDDVILKNYFAAAVAAGMVPPHMAVYIEKKRSSRDVLDLADKVGDTRRKAEAVILVRRYLADHPDDKAAHEMIKRLEARIDKEEDEAAGKRSRLALWAARRAQNVRRRLSAAE